MISKQPTEENIKKSLEYYNQAQKEVNEKIKNNQRERQKKEIQEEDNGFFSEEEFNILQRLERIDGFTLDEIMDAYIICNNNVKLADIYLFVNKEKNTVNYHK